MLIESSQFAFPTKIPINVFRAAVMLQRSPKVVGAAVWIEHVAWRHVHPGADLEAAVEATVVTCVEDCPIFVVSKRGFILSIIWPRLLGIGASNVEFNITAVASPLGSVTY